MTEEYKKNQIRPQDKQLSYQQGRVMIKNSGGHWESVVPQLEPRAIDRLEQAVVSKKRYKIPGIVVGLIGVPAVVLTAVDVTIGSVWFAGAIKSAFAVVNVALGTGVFALVLPYAIPLLLLLVVSVCLCIGFELADQEWRAAADEKASLGVSSGVPGMGYGSVSANLPNSSSLVASNRNASDESSEDQRSCWKALFRKRASSDPHAFMASQRRGPIALGSVRTERVNGQSTIIDDFYGGPPTTY